MTAAEWLLFATILLAAAIIAITWREWEEDDWRNDLQNTGEEGGAAKPDNPPKPH